jgi:hypothetical protein
MSHPLTLPTMETLRHHVLVMLCRHDNLDPLQTPMVQSVIVKRGQPCGLFFQVQGPRRLCNYAVWSVEEKRILYYTSTGERLAETRLRESPALPAA